VIVGIIRDGDDALLRIVNCVDERRLGIAHEEGRLELNRLLGGEARSY
jgi:hypothetical protein